MYDILSQAVAVGVLVALGGALTGARLLWVRALGVLVFVAAFVVFMTSPALLTGIAIILMVLVGANVYLAHRKKRKERAKNQELLDAIRDGANPRGRHRA